MFWSRITSGALVFYTRSNSMAPGERENPGARGDMTDGREEEEMNGLRNYPIISEFLSSPLLCLYSNIAFQ